MSDIEPNQYEAFLSDRRERILARASEAVERSGRSLDDITMLAVSKTVGPDEVYAAWKAGYRSFAENRPQELKRKLAGVEDHPDMAGVRFDMIGNLQTNKINQVVGKVTLVHSVSSTHLAEAIAKRALAHGVDCDVLLECNVSGEESKSGFAPDEVRAALPKLMGLGGISIKGLMTMAPAHDEDAARRTFSGLRDLADVLRGDSGLALDTLSMGMSDDFPIALEEGATVIRLGRIVFDPCYEPAW